MDEVTRLLAAIKLELARKAATFQVPKLKRLVAETKPGRACFCDSCWETRLDQINMQACDG